MNENPNVPAENKGTNLIRQYIINNYVPAKDYGTAQVRLSTVQLYNKMIAMFPDADLSVSDLYIFLEDQDYIQEEIRPFQAEWIFDKKSDVV